MKTHLYILALVAIGLSACGPTYVIHQDPPPAPAPAPPPPANPDDVTYQSFYDQLSPYGQWIEDPDYGYVWLPDVSSDFKPYATNGNWVYTDEGWTWDSGYPWGWATFHYGRWFFQDGFGWMWIPGSDWAPAWVSWRNSDEYYGWAPMGPNVSFDAAYGGGYNPPAYYWNFVPHQYIASPQMHNYYVRESSNITIINRTTIIRNTTVVNRPRNSHYGYGPDPNEVGRYSGSSIRPTVIRESRTPGERANNGNMTVYRPRVIAAPDSRSNNAGRPFAPSRVQNLNNARPVNRTVYNNGGRDDRNNNDRNNNDRNNNRNNNDRNNNGNNGYNNGNNGGRDDRNNSWDNRNNNNGGRTNTGFPNNPPAQNNRPVQNNTPNRPDIRGNNPQPQPANPPAQNNPPAPNNPPAQNNTPNRPFNRPPASQPANPAVRQLIPQPAAQPVPQQAIHPIPQPRQQPAPQPAPPPRQQPVTQPAPSQPANQHPQRPAFQRSDRPANTPPAVRTFTPQPNPNQQRSAAMPPRPAPSQPSNPPPARRDDSRRPAGS